MHKITITKIDHDDYLGYYIGDELYAYTEYNNITYEEVSLEGILRAMEAGLIKHRNEATVSVVDKYELPNFSHEADEETINNLPQSLEELKAIYAAHGD
jgi:hypothetical protein